MPNYESLQDHNKTASERVKTLLSILAIFLMGFFAGAVFLDGIVKHEEIREAEYAENDCRKAPTGAHCFINGREAVIITAKGASHE